MGEQEHKSSEPKRTHEVTFDRLRGQVNEPAFAPDRKTSEDTHRDGLVKQVQGIADSLHDIMATAIHSSIRTIGDADPVNASGSGPVLAGIVAMGVAGFAGSAAVIAFSQVASKVAQKFFEDSVKEAVKRMGKVPSGNSPARAIPAFHAKLLEQLLQLKLGVRAAMSARHDHLHSLSTANLETLAATAGSLNSDSERLIRVASNEVMMMWCNFIATAKHGAMPSYEVMLQEDKPHTIPLRGAQRVSGTPGRGAENVDPDAMWPKIEPRQRSDQDYAGILEIGLTRQGHLVQSPQYRMRLDGVGDGARSHMRALGSVRAARINKVVRICDEQRGFVLPEALIYIAADGHVRGATGLYRPDEERCEARGNSVLDAVLGERCTTDYSLNREAVSRYAELAQDLPLKHLEQP